MALPAELKCLERRRRELVARNDELREGFAEQCAQVSSPSFWLRESLDFAQRALTSRALISAALGFLNKLRK